MLLWCEIVPMVIWFLFSMPSIRHGKIVWKRVSFTNTPIQTTKSSEYQTKWSKIRRTKDKLVWMKEKKTTHYYNTVRLMCHFFPKSFLVTSLTSLIIDKNEVRRNKKKNLSNQHIMNIILDFLFRTAASLNRIAAWACYCNATLCVIWIYAEEFFA